MKRLTCSVGLACIALGGGIAQAEGGWSSSLSGVLTGYDSRQWTDNNSDNNSTTVNLNGCVREFVGGGNRTGTNARAEVRRTISALPDEFLGTQDVCGSNIGNWGDVRSGTYRWRVTSIGGSASGYQLDASSLYTNY